MQVKRKYRIKNILLKVMAVFITLCYMIQPAQNELRQVLHFISHNLQPPNNILQHDNNKAYQHIVNYKDNFLSHEHEILDFIDKVFNSSSEKSQHQGKFKNELLSIKKIMVYHDYRMLYDDLTNSNRLDNFKIINDFKTKGHSLQLYRPPQLLGNV